MPTCAAPSPPSAYHSLPRRTTVDSWPVHSHSGSPQTDICTVPIAEGDVDAWAKGMGRLRPENIAVWQERFRRMEAFRKQTMRMKGSAAITRSGYCMTISVPVLLSAGFFKFPQKRAAIGSRWAAKKRKWPGEHQLNVTLQPVVMSERMARISEWACYNAELFVLYYMSSESMSRPFAIVSGIIGRQVINLKLYKALSTASTTAINLTLLGVQPVPGKPLPSPTSSKKVQRPTLIIAIQQNIGRPTLLRVQGILSQQRRQLFRQLLRLLSTGKRTFPGTICFIERDIGSTKKSTGCDWQRQPIYSRSDTIIVASVSCIYGLGDPVNWGKVTGQVDTRRPVPARKRSGSLARIQYGPQRHGFADGSVRQPAR